MCKSIIYHILVILLLSLMPITGMAQQNTDIKKPTRTRTTEKDKKSTDNKDTKNNKKAPQESQPAVKNTDKKNEPQPVKAVDVPAKNVDTKANDKKAEDPASKQETVKSATDTAVKPAAPPKPKRVPVDADKVQFDGIDVSKHQGVIDWAELRKYSKIQFVYIKATEGSNYVDPRYRQNINNARKNGFKVGSYHYFTDLSSATLQFQNFIRTAKREEQDLVPVIDVEKRNKWTPQQLRDSVKVFADLLEDYYGCKPIIYTFETFFTRNLGKAFEKYPIFIAKYPKGQEQPNINGIKWILWQFSECGKFKGVKDNLVDMSRFNKGCSINDIIYVPSKHKPKNPSVMDAVDHKDKPATVNMTEQKGKEAPKPTKKQQEEAKKQAEKEKNSKERSRKLAEEEAKKKAEADRKAKEKAEASRKAKEKAEANKKAKEKAEADRKAKEKAEQQKREKARQQAREAEAKKEAEAKAQRKAQAQKTRSEQQAKQNASGKSNKSSSLMNAPSSKLSQTQRNDSIRNAGQIGRKTNKSSADND